MGQVKRATSISWCIEPQIDSERQLYLADHRSIAANDESGIYPFRDVRLSRADVEWLLVTDQDRPEPVGLRNGCARAELDLRGALLQQVNLSNLPLAGLLGGRNWLVYPTSTEQPGDYASIHLEGADLSGAQLEESFLGGAYMEECCLEGAHLEGAHLEGAHLEGADLTGAHLEGANLASASLKGMPTPADFLKRIRHWDREILTPANLHGAFLDSSTILEDIVLGDTQFGFVSLADLHWGGVNLSVVEWEAVTMLGDERRARQTTWLFDYEAAMRANRQLASALDEQGLREAATHFAYRAEFLQRSVLWRQMKQARRQGRKGAGRLAHKLGDLLFSWFLDLIAGYGYKPLRALIAYLLTIVAFSVIYYLQGLAIGPHFTWMQSLITSLTAFHGLAFFPAQFGLSGPQALTCAIESFVGFMIVVGLITAFARRILRRK